MPRPREAGVSILSIDLDASGAPSTSEANAFESQLRQLRDRLAEAEIPVTWGLPANDAALGHVLLDQPTGSEFALAADRTWCGEGSSRRAFAAGLEQAVSRFASVGLTATTLLLTHGRPEPHDDLIMKFGMNMIRVGQCIPAVTAKRSWRWRSRSSWQPETVRFVRWGLWEAVVTASLAADGERAALRAVDRVSRVGGLAVVVINARLLFVDERLTSRLIAHFHRRRDETALRIETFASLAAARQTSRSTPIARSVLRPTAA